MDPKATRHEPVAAANLAWVEELYGRYLEDPAAVDPEWQSYFAAMGDGGRTATAAARWRQAVAGPRLRPASIFNPPGGEAPEPADELPAIADPDLAARVRSLGRIRLFADVPEAELALIARLGTELELADGEYLCHDCEHTGALYLLTEGSLLVRRRDNIIATLNPGDVVGELAVLDSQVESPDVSAHGPARLLRVARDDLLALVERRSALARGLVQTLSARLRQRGTRQDQVNQLIHAYRVRGHLRAALDPLGRPRAASQELALEHYGLGERDLDAVFSTTGIAGTTVLSLREILALLERTYCGAVGVQFMHIDDLRAKRWLLTHLEDSQYHRPLGRDEQLRVLTKLTDAEIFEQFIHRKFLGAKRFSLEGAETLIPLLDLTLDEAGCQGVREVVVGMAHRGRLNVLVNVMAKSAREVFSEFADQDAEAFIGRGDVKYHLGASTDMRTSCDNELHISLCFNPSHLEYVDPVALGRVRAKQDRDGDRERRRAMGIVIHGDAAFAGQGVVAELLNLSDLDGYRTGGTVHVIVNNQIGFTTPPEAGRSTKYASDVARMLQTPVFHVNGEDPEAVAHVVRLAMAYRYEFQQDVVVDMYCYRRHGHNEGDEPAYTQPLLYEAINRRQSVREAYVEHLLRLGEVTREEADEIVVRRRQALEDELAEARQPDYHRRGVSSGEGIWRPYRGGPDRALPEVETGVAREKLSELLLATNRVPEGFHPHPKLRRLFRNREEMAAGKRPLDWAAGEALALASLLVAGTRIRFSGQDSSRGTFSHRHATLHDAETGQAYTPLMHLSPDQAEFQIWDSPLSEIGVLGFEFGYSLDTPDGLTVWEAQFGDFCNVAQVIIDQFISSCEDKWNRLNGLVMLLPHGFEGQGPEHSSARLERFLNLAAEDNIQVVNLTTPAQLFHCLRRQVLRPWRKPLIVMSPKSLLRHPQVVSSLDELATGRFQRLIADPVKIDPRGVRRVLLTSGKIYYELAAARQERELRDVAIVRLEQYYPLSEEELAAALAPYPDSTPVVWVQEEPRNMGARAFLRFQFGDVLCQRWPFSCVSRPESASPATGSHAAHQQEQAEVIDQALGG